MLDLTWERLRAGLGWFALALLCAPFEVALLWITARRIFGWMPGEVPLAVFATSPVFLGAIGSLPGFLLAPWLVARLPWLDRGVRGVSARSCCRCQRSSSRSPFLRSLPIDAVCLVAFGSIAAPRLFAKSLQLGALSS